MKKLTLAEFLGSISIESCTENTAQQLVDAGYDTLEKIKCLTLGNISIIGSEDGRTIGPKRALKILNSIHSNRIQSYFVHIKGWVSDLPKVQKTDLGHFIDLNGKNVCFTGAAQMPRKALISLLKSLGARVQSSVNNKTDILFIADINSTSSKTTKAKDLGVELKAYSEIGA